MSEIIEILGKDREKIKFLGKGQFEIIPEVSVPEYLERDQNLFDQPPYSWLFLDEEIFPTGFFVSEIGERLMISAIARFNPEASERKISLFKRVSKYVDSGLIEKLGFKSKRRALEVKTRQALGYLDQYPYSLRYTREERDKFSSEGNYVQRGGEPQKIKTYAAFADACLEYELGARWAGLDEELPNASAEEEIIDAITQGKGKVNRFFRLVKKSEAFG